LFVVIGGDPPETEAGARVRVRETTHKCGSTSDVIKAGHVLSPGNGHAREKWTAVRGLGGFLAGTSMKNWYPLLCTGAEF
jgi:hypothetical protein